MAVYVQLSSMDVSRRDLTFVLSTFAAFRAGAAQEQLPTFSTRVYGSDEIPYHGDQTKKGRQFFNGVTHSGFHVEVHETILGPGVETHAPHKHEHEEMIFMMEGTLETHVEGKTARADKGSVIFFGSNQMHNARNVGTTHCRYFVVELRGV